MTAGNWNRIKEICGSALEKPAHARAAFLDHECGNDENLRAEVQRLLACDEMAGDFLEAPLLHPRNSLSPGTLVSTRYRITKIIGRGGMGEVYEASDELLNESIALKTLRADLQADPEILVRFQREIQLARKITHPNICRVFEVGVDPSTGLHFFTMELLAGETLSSAIQSKGHLKKVEALPLITQLADGLHAAHQLGIVHRDFKSSNIMLSNGKAVITDFGLAGWQPGASPTGTPTKITQGLNVAGTLAYMSPEQLSGSPITTASDIYSLGVVMYEMATGQLPHEDKHVLRAAMQKATGSAPSLKTIQPDIDPQWAKVIERCLEADPTKRYATATEVATSLSQSQTWTRRRWIGATAVATAVSGIAVYWNFPRKYQPKPEAMSWWLQAISSMQTGNLAASRKRLEQAVKLDPNFVRARIELARIYDQLDYADLSKDTLLPLLSARVPLSSDDALRLDAIRLAIARDFSQAEPLFAELASNADSASKPQALLELASVRDNAEDPLGAMNAVASAIQLDPNFAPARLREGLLNERARKVDAALQSLSKAESLFDAQSNYEGIAQTLLQRTTLLSRSNQAQAAIPEAQRGLKLSSSIGDTYHEVRLLLALSLAYRKLDRTKEAHALAEQAVHSAQDLQMSNIAAVGLNDLGNDFFQRGEYDQARALFEQALELARRDKGYRNIARAQLSIGSLLVQSDSPTDPQPYLESAANYYARSGYKREVVQAQLLLADSLNQRSEPEQAEAIIRKILPLADALRDADQASSAYSLLSGILFRSGRWPEALERAEHALRLKPNSLPTIYRVVQCGAIYAALGRYQQAAQSFDRASASVAKLDGQQVQLRARILKLQAEMAYTQELFDEARQLATKAVALKDTSRDGQKAELLLALCQIRFGALSTGQAACHKIIENLRGEYAVSSAKLALAEALWNHGAKAAASTEATQALPLFENSGIHEASWRAYRVADMTNQSRTALHALRSAWPAAMFQDYSNRRDIKKLLPA